MIRANQLIESEGIFTGDLSNDIITKYNRIEALSKDSSNYIFIGDNKDEIVVNKYHNVEVRFINYKNVNIEKHWTKL